MKKDIINLKTTLPTVNKTYFPLDTFGKTVGRYFDYKKETAMIKYETQKVKEQSKVAIKQIDAELKKSLDANSKNFKNKMVYLKNIAKTLESSSTNQKMILENIAELTKMLTNPDMPKEYILNMIVMAHQQLNNERNSSMQNINIMGNFDQNQKKIGEE